MCWMDLLQGVGNLGNSLGNLSHHFKDLMEYFELFFFLRIFLRFQPTDQICVKLFLLQELELLLEL